MAGEKVEVEAAGEDDKNQEDIKESFMKKAYLFYNEDFKNLDLGVGHPMLGRIRGFRLKIL